MDLPLIFALLGAVGSKRSRGSPWETIGFVVISETGIADPFSPEYRAIVGPRACRMGGEGVAIFQSSTNEQVMGSGSGTTYGVLRKKR